LHPSATSCHTKIITRNEQVSGSSPLVGSPFFFSFAGKMQEEEEPLEIVRGLEASLYEVRGIE
jgi:hypothetical protein